MKNRIMTLVFTAFIFCFSAMCIMKPPTIMSESERRELAAMPEFNSENVLNGSFMTDFEKYSTDQIPFRDFFRGLKANFVTKVLNKSDNNSIFEADGHVSKMEYPQNESMMEYAYERFSAIFEKYLSGKDMNVYLSIVPDKNMYLAEENGYLSLDYEKFMTEFAKMCDFAEYIDITNLLEKDDYYTTDTHWKMENITDVAEFILSKMGIEIKGDYMVNTLEKPFYGVYAGQSALNVKPDEMKYLTNDIIKNCIVTYYDTGMGKVGDMYNMDKADGKDMYEMFLSGSTPLCTIENPNSENDKELILFRDSFGSSIAPLFSSGYSKITVIDIRYIQSDFLGSFVDFKEGSDVLFLYSTMLLNNSLALR